IACVLDIERIPYRRIWCPADFDARLLVVSGDHVTPAVLQLAAHAPTLIVGSPASPPRELFGVAGGHTVRTATATVALGEPIWPESVRALARRFGKQVLTLPSAPVFRGDAPPEGLVLARLACADGMTQPAIVQSGSSYWSLVDLGAAFAHLLDES